MRTIYGAEIIPGLYTKLNSEKSELYEVHNSERGLVAIDVEGNSFLLEDPGYYESTRNPVSEGSLDSFDLCLVKGEIYEKLKTELVNSKKRTSKLLKMLENNKDNLSAETKTVKMVSQHKKDLENKFWGLSDHLD